MAEETKRVIIAGGSGFIGRSLCRALLAKGYQVSVLTRGAARQPLMTPQGPVPAFHSWDGRSASGWGHMVDGAYALVNLVGESLASSRWSSAKKERLLRSRLTAGQAIVEAVTQVRVKPRVLVQASGSGYYGSRGDEPLDEFSAAGRGFLADLAMRWESSTQAVEGMGLRRVIARSGVVLGRGGGLLERMLLSFRLYLGGAFGNGRQGFPWIHLDDEVGALVFLLEHPQASGPFNLVAPENVTNLGFCLALAKALDRPCGFNIPAVVLRLVFGEMADELLLSGNMAFPKHLLELGYVFQYPKLEQALKQLLGQEKAC
jgi:hypothetical protein